MKSQARHHKASLRGRKRAARRDEGAVLLVIMLIIIITTAAAAVSIRNTSAEVRASGRELMTIQARYTAEGALVTTMAYIDRNKVQLMQLWPTLTAGAVHDMRRNTAGHVIANDGSRRDAIRLTGTDLAVQSMTVLPISAANLAAPIPDPTGSFGPNAVYEAATYEIDFTDCVRGAIVEGNSQKTQTRYCVMTVRNRLVISGGAGRQLSWVNVGGGPTVLQDRTGAAHDAQATVLTPPVLVGDGGEGDG